MTDFPDKQQHWKAPALRDPPSAPVREVAKALIGLLPGSSMYQLLFEQAWEDPKQAALRNFALSLAEKIEKLDRNQEIDLVLALAKPETQPLLIQASMQRLQVVETERGAAPELRSHLMDNPRRDTFDDLVSGD